MQCPRCGSPFDTPVKGATTRIALVRCPNCDYSRSAKINRILRYILEDYAENIGLDPKNVEGQPRNPEELDACLKELLSSNGLSELPLKAPKKRT